MKTLLTADFEKPFNLETESPVRAQLLEVKPHKHILGIVAHHLAVDGWSLARVLEHSCHAYNALVKGESPPPLPWEPYWEYLEEFDRQMAKPALRESRAYWEKVWFAPEPK